MLHNKRQISSRRMKSGAHRIMLGSAGRALDIGGTVLGTLDIHRDIPDAGDALCRDLVAVMGDAQRARRVLEQELERRTRRKFDDLQDA